MKKKEDTKGKPKGNLKDRMIEAAMKQQSVRDTLTAQDAAKRKQKINELMGKSEYSKKAEYKKGNTKKDQEAKKKRKEKQKEDLKAQAKGVRSRANLRKLRKAAEQLGLTQK